MSVYFLPDFPPFAPLWCLCGDNVSVTAAGGEGEAGLKGRGEGLPPRLALQTLGSSSNQSAIRRRLLWATDDSSSDYPGVTAGIFSISAASVAPRRLKAFSAPELQELHYGSYGSGSRVRDVELGRSEQEMSARP